MKNLTSDEIKAVIIANAKKSAENMRVALEVVATVGDISKEIKLKFAKKLVKEFEAKLGEREYKISCDVDESMRRFLGFDIVKRSWGDVCPCFCIEAQQGNMWRLIYGISKEKHGAPGIQGLDDGANDGWHCYYYFSNQYASWDGAEMLTNMAIEAGMFGAETKPSYPVADVYVNTMIALIDKKEGIIDNYIAEKKKGDNNPF